MKFEWDEDKARRNRAKHGIAFEAVRRFDFDTALYRVDAMIDYDEERWKAVGMIDGLLYNER